MRTDVDPALLRLLTVLSLSPWTVLKPLLTALLFQRAGLYDPTSVGAAHTLWPLAGGHLCGGSSQAPAGARQVLGHAWHGLSVGTTVGCSPSHAPPSMNKTFLVFFLSDTPLDYCF